MASRTFRRVASEIGLLPLITYETVLWETPASRATSLLVNFVTLLFVSDVVDAYRRCASTMDDFYHRRSACATQPSFDLVRTAATALGEGGMVVSLIHGHLAAARL
jgi:hypothetical protein